MEYATPKKSRRFPDGSNLERVAPCKEEPVHKRGRACRIFGPW